MNNGPEGIIHFRADYHLLAQLQRVLMSLIHLVDLIVPFIKNKFFEISFVGIPVCILTVQYSNFYRVVFFLYVQSTLDSTVEYKYKLVSFWVFFIFFYGMNLSYYSLNFNSYTTVCVYEIRFSSHNKIKRFLLKTYFHFYR
jgi:hypothetical protein